MKLKEEKELQAIVDDYKKAIHTFRRREFKKADEMFTQIIDKYKNSEFDSVLEIQTRSKVYQSIAYAHLHPVKLTLKNNEDILWEGTYQLNAGNYEKALELLGKLEKANAKDGFLYFLMAQAYHQLGDIDSTLKYLKKCIKEDKHYRIVIFNEPIFESLQENAQFLAIVE